MSQAMREHHLVEYQSSPMAHTTRRQTASKGQGDQDRFYLMMVMPWTLIDQ
jgi:hypothetical protein